MARRCHDRFRVFLGAIVVALSMTLQGCVAAAIPLALGVSGYATFKTIQLSTGEGEVQVGFEREVYTAEERNALAQVHSLAIFPLSADDTELEVAMAEKLSANGSLQIITPSVVLQTQGKGVGSTNFNALTRDEKTDVIRELCRDLDADGLVYVQLVGSSVNQNTWSFSRPNMAYQIEMVVFSSLDDRVIIVDKIKAKIVVAGSSTTSVSEADRILGAALAERIQNERR